MRPMKLRTKLVLGGICSLAIPILLIGIVAVYQSSQKIAEMAKNHMTIIAASLADTVGVGLSERLAMVKNITFSNSIIGAVEKVSREGVPDSRPAIALAEDELTRIKASEGDRLSSVNVALDDGIFFASSGRTFIGLNVKDRAYFKTVMAGTPNIGAVIKSRATGRVVCTAAAPVYIGTDKAVQGAVVMAMELKYLTDIIDKVKIGKGGYAYMVDKSGLYITYPDKQKILDVNIAEVKGLEALSQLVREAKPGLVEYELDGTPTLAAVAFEPLTGWGIIASIPKNELYAPARYTRNGIVTIGVICLLLASFIFIAFARKLTRPLLEVADVAQQIAAGDLGGEVDSVRSREDEIGQLTQSFSRMTHSLRTMAGVAAQIAAGDLRVNIQPQSDKDQLGNSFVGMVETLRTTTADIAEAVNLLGSSASEILAATTQVAAGSAETATAISETTTTVEEVRQAAQLSAQKAKKVADSAQRVSQVSQAGQKAVEESALGMQQIRQQMDSIATTIVRLSEQGQSIGGIIASVTDLADQSNLLAVNAAIEAARAGEQGKGFTVVAQEIRSLAEQSKQATTEVRSILKDLQKATGAAVMATEQGSKAVDAGVQQSTQAGETIRALSESVREALQASTQISASSQQQVVGMDQIATAMESINQAGAQTAASMKQSETAAMNLHEIGQTLKRLLEQYKV